MSDNITVTGNITQPELRYTTSGIPVVSFRVASTQRRYDKGEEKWVDGATNWFGVSVYRRLGEHAFRSLRKGDRVVVTGKLRLKGWENGDKKGLAVEIDADALGHDLQWGTTTFHRDAPSHSEQQAAQPGSDAVGWPTASPGEERATTELSGTERAWGAGAESPHHEDEWAGDAEADAGPALALAGSIPDAPF